MRISRVIETDISIKVARVTLSRLIFSRYSRVTFFVLSLFFLCFRLYFVSAFSLLSVFFPCSFLAFVTRPSRHFSYLFLISDLRVQCARESLSGASIDVAAVTQLSQC
jgi:hypothetical protein